MTGSAEDVATLNNACDFYAECTRDMRPALKHIERVIAPVGTVIDSDCYQTISQALMTKEGRVCVAMLLACGVNEQFDLQRGITYFQNLSKDKEGWGTAQAISLLELHLERPDGRLRDLIEEVGL